ncbi:MAG TPA: trehalose-phosphatase [Acidimicrobiales bacterium]|nr:trehalose-phosphatase [Acidimicrobiales bacterium]
MTEPAAGADLAGAAAPFRAAPAECAIVTDFDGTLAPIVDDPITARALDGAVEVLHALSERYGRVAVVSGRPVEFLGARLHAAGRDDLGLVISGLYGLERLERGHVMIHPSALRWIDVVAGVVERAEKEAPPGVRVERKGLSTTLHVREAPDAAGWARSFADAAAATTGLVVHDARMSFELRPPVGVDKGTVVAELTEGMSAACFLGDDYGDLPAFDALDRLAARSGSAVLRVAVRSEEAPPELLSRADLLVDGPAGALAFLRALL